MCQDHQVSILACLVSYCTLFGATEASALSLGFVGYTIGTSTQGGVVVVMRFL